MDNPPEKKSKDSPALRAKIERECRNFDLLSLIHLLGFMGYGFDDIFFKGHIGTESQTSMIRSVAFHIGTPRPVVIRLNMGLMSAQGVLPSYFLKKIEVGEIDERAFKAFIGFFDHYLLRSYLLSLYPEINPRAFSDWELTKRRYLWMTNLKTDKSLYSLFQLAFPELGIKVRKRIFRRTVETVQPVIGSARLGDDAVFGRLKKVPAYGSQIKLYTDDGTTSSGTPWPEEIKARLESLVFPSLRPVGIDMEVVLVVRAQKTRAKLNTDSYLGYDRIQGGTAAYRNIRIFRGEVN